MISGVYSRLSPRIQIGLGSAFGRGWYLFRGAGPGPIDRIPTRAASFRRMDAYEEPPVARKMRKRAESWRAVFGAVILFGLLGSFLIARAAGSTTDVFGQTTHDSSTQILTFVISTFSTLLFAAPFLAFSQILEGQADLYES